jgi:hypothetical protein
MGRVLGHETSAFAPAMSRRIYAFAKLGSKDLLDISHESPTARQHIVRQIVMREFIPVQVFL